MTKSILALILTLFVLNNSAWADRPNIVFFFTDDQTIDTLGCYGNDIVKTPNIDALARRGTKFQNAFVSHSICWVSRTTILTGLTGRTYGTPGNRDQARPEAVQTLYSDILRREGYRTGYFGKWHARMPNNYRKEEHFDEFLAIGRSPFYKKQPDGSLRHETELIVDRGIEFLKTQPKDQPFALNLWFNACHAEDRDRRPGIGHFPWPRAVDGMYDGIQFPPPRLNDPAIFDALPDFLRTTINRERYFWRWNTPEKYQTNMQAYYRMVSGIDGAIGRFIRALEEAGLADNTIIVYSADNGYHMGNRGLAGKWSHFEESLRVPMIIADPRVPKSKQGTTSDAIALNLDLPATFLDWANADIPTRYQGHSLKPIVNGETPPDWRTESFHEHFAVRHRIPAFEGIRNQDFKFVRYVDHEGHEFLHDLKNDPNELINLANDPDHKATVDAMRNRLDQRVQQLGGPLLPPKAKFAESTKPHPEASAMVGSRAGKNGFVRIFDGRSLRNWDGDKSLWSVEDGALTGSSNGNLKMNRFLTWTHSTVRNFDLRVKVKITAGGNSGIQYRSTSRPEIGLDVVSGYQCDIIPDQPKYNGMVYEERGRSVLAEAGQTTNVLSTDKRDVTQEFPTQAMSADQWQEFRILVRGNHHQHWINGNKISESFDLDESNRSLEGVLALQLHTGAPMKIQFKDFRIKHLPDNLPLKRPSEGSEK